MLFFETPGRNDPCHCTSGKKYKRCHETIDQSAWRFVMLKIRQAESVRETLPKMEGVDDDDDT